jgi:hypothetical protein
VSGFKVCSTWNVGYEVIDRKCGASLNHPPPIAYPEVSNGLPFTNPMWIGTAGVPWMAALDGAAWTLRGFRSGRAVSVAGFERKVAVSWKAIAADAGPESPYSAQLGGDGGVCCAHRCANGSSVDSSAVSIASAACS